VVMVFVVNFTSINILAVVSSAKSRDLCPVVVAGNSGISVVMVFVVNSTSLNILVVVSSAKSRDVFPVVVVAGNSGNSVVLGYVVTSFCVVESCCVPCTALTGSEFRNSSGVTASPGLSSCVTSGPLDAGFVCVLVTAGSGSCTLVLSAVPSVALEFCCRGPTAPGGSENGLVVVGSVGPEVNLLASSGRSEVVRDVVNCPSSVVRENVGSMFAVFDGAMVVSEYGSGRTGFSCPATKACLQASTHSAAKTVWK